MSYGWGGAFALVALLVYLVVAAVAFGLLYLCIRLAVLSALKAHTQWLQAGGAARPQHPPAPPRPGEPPRSGEPPRPGEPPQPPYGG